MAWGLGFPDVELTRCAHRLRGLGGLRREIRLACRGTAVRWRAANQYAARLDAAWAAPPDHSHSDVSEDMDLYGLFTSAVSVIESMAYAAHALGAIRDRRKFPMGTDSERRGIGLATTSQRFAQKYPGHVLTRALTRASYSGSLRGIREARNVLTHRATEQRLVVITSAGSRREWTIGERVNIDTVILDSRYLQSILQATAGHAMRIGCGLDAFTAEYFAAPHQGC